MVAYNSTFRSIIDSRLFIARSIGGLDHGGDSRDSRFNKCQRRSSIVDLSGRVLAQSSLRTSAAYGIAHDTEAAGSLALEANLSRGFAGSRVKFLRMHRRLPSLPIPPHPPSVGVAPLLVLPCGIYLLVLSLAPFFRRLSSFNFPLIVLPFLPPPSFLFNVALSSLVVFSRRPIPVASSSFVSFPSSR